MELVLTDNIRGLGNTGDIVQVKPGFGRNYLLPKRLAVTPTEGNKLKYSREREDYLFQEKDRIESAQLIATKLGNLVLNVTMKANEVGQLFGSVTEQIVATSLSEEIGIEIEPKKIVLGSHHKKVGEYPFGVRLHSEVEVDMMLIIHSEVERDEEVVAEDEEASAEDGEAVEGEAEGQAEASDEESEPND